MQIYLIFFYGGSLLPGHTVSINQFSNLDRAKNIMAQKNIRNKVFKSGNRIVLIHFKCKNSLLKCNAFVK